MFVALSVYCEMGSWWCVYVVNGWMFSVTPPFCHMIRLYKSVDQPPSNACKHHRHGRHIILTSVTPSSIILPLFLQMIKKKKNAFWLIMRSHTKLSMRVQACGVQVVKKREQHHLVANLLNNASLQSLQLQRPPVAHTRGGREVLCTAP